MKNEIFEGSVPQQSMELILAIRHQDEQFKKRLENLKFALEKIDANFRKRMDEISNQSETYLPAIIQDMEYNLRVATRAEIEELVRSRGFAKEIDDATVELQKQEPENDIQKLTRVLQEVEIRRLMAASGDNFQADFLAKILDGDPLVISSIENSPLPFPVDESYLVEGRRHRDEIKKPLIYKKYQALKQTQNSLEALANAIMPLDSERDTIAEMAYPKD